MRVNTKNICIGEKEVVSISTNSKFNGNVMVKLGANNYIVNLLNGKGSLSIPNLPEGHYVLKVTSSSNDLFKGDTVTKTFDVKRIVKLTLKNLKKYSKKVVLSAVLKVNNKPMLNKAIKFKLFGKTYSAKTNSKGLAKVIIKNKKTLKKIKKGKKVSNSAYVKFRIYKNINGILKPFDLTYTSNKIVKI